MPKRRGRKAAAPKKISTRKEKDPLAEEKKLKLVSILAEFDQSVEDHCSTIESNMMTSCSDIQALYNNALLAIPSEYRHLTKEQYKEKMKSKDSDISKAVDDSISKLVDMSSIMSRYESCLSLTAKKKEKVKESTNASKIENKSEDSVKTSVSSSMGSTRRAVAQVQKTVTPGSQHRGLPLNFTPKAKQAAVFDAPLVVKPKFDPRKPLASPLLRKPNAGEIVMSMSGSPLQIPTIDVSLKPGIMVTFGGELTSNVGDSSGCSGIEMSPGQSTKQILKLLNDKLSKVLAA